LILRVVATEMNHKATQLSTAEELFKLAWNVGVVYFQVYEDKPNSEFYKHLPPLEHYERIVEIEANSKAASHHQLAFKGGSPFFGAIAGGWSHGLTDNPESVGATVALARKYVVLPGSIRKREHGDDDDWLIEGPPIRDL
jgi:hypothetical protein